MKKLLSLFALLFISTHGFADENLLPVKITQVGSAWERDAIFISSTNSMVVENCNPSNLRVVLTADHPLFDQILSIVLTAYVSNKDVIFRISGCTHGSFMNVLAARVND